MKNKSPTPDQKNDALLKNKDTSSSTQRMQILALLKRHLSINTLEFRDIHGILSPAPRVFELRLMGYEILTHLENIRTPDGRLHKRVARYYLTFVNDAQVGLAA
jgi:hypothetical protein|tara:strand:+ start:134 stop:445 length:312 start_codon:yes stop_codon:yes gene_type:complete